MRTECILWIPGSRQVQRDESGFSCRRQIGMEIDTVQVNQVRIHCGRSHSLSHGRIPHAAHRTVDVAAGRTRNRHQSASGHRAFACHDNRAVPGGDESAIQRGEHLLGAANRIRPNRRKRIGDIQDGQQRKAFVASSHHLALVIPQSKSS